LVIRQPDVYRQIGRCFGAVWIDKVIVAPVRSRSVNSLGDASDIGASHVRHGAVQVEADLLKLLPLAFG
jgi:hypothetical protein